MSGSESCSRVLIAEADPGLQTMLVDAFLHLGYEPQVVSSSREAWRELLRARYAVLVVDVRLSGGTGLELAREIRQRGFLLPVLILSNPDDLSLLEAAVREIGEAEYLLKPFDLTDLQEAVQGLGLEKAPRPDAGTAGQA